MRRWIKDFLYVFLDKSMCAAKKGFYILPIISHTVPNGDILGSQLTKYRCLSLRLYPFSLQQSMQLLQLRRRQKGLDCRAVTWELWKPVVALAGGHPGFLLDGFMSLLNVGNVGLNPASVSIAVGALLSDKCHR